MTGDLKECVEKNTGQIMVNEFGQATNMHPLTKVNQPSSPKVQNNIFSIGDVCLSHANEAKTIPSMYQYCYQVIWNVYTAATGGDPAHMQKIPAMMHVVQMLPCGDSKGLMSFNKMLKRDDTIPKQKDQMRDGYMAEHHGDKKAAAANAKNGKDFAGFMGIANGCCYCLPMHISKSKEYRELEKKGVIAKFDAAYR